RRRQAGWPSAYASFPPPSAAITNLDARGCRLRALDRFFSIFSPSEGDAHPAVLESDRLRENSEVDGPPRGSQRERFGYSFIGESIRFAIGKDHRRCGRTNLFDRRDRKAEDRAQVKLELVGELRDQGHHAGVVRPGRQLREDR